MIGIVASICVTVVVVVIVAAMTVIRLRTIDRAVSLATTVESVASRVLALEAELTELSERVRRAEAHRTVRR